MNSSLFSITPVPTMPPAFMIFNFPAPPLQNLLFAPIFVGGLYMLAKYMWMVYYQYKYGGDYGERYIRGLISKEEKAELKIRRLYKK